MSPKNQGRRVTTRYVPDKPLPPYAYVPGWFPHPTRDPNGHSYGAVIEHPEPPDPENWRSCRPYFCAVDLFNHGYFWEAHEAWEELWNASPRFGPTRHFLQGLIRLAASAVKAREGNTRGVQRHSRRAAQLFRETAADGASDEYMGLSLGELIRLANKLAVGSEMRILATGDVTEARSNFTLRLAERS